jgi:hypothetical protein
MTHLGRALLSIFFVLLLVPTIASAQPQQPQQPEPGPGGQRAIIVREIVVQGTAASRKR